MGATRTANEPNWGGHGGATDALDDTQVRPAMHDKEMATDPAEFWARRRDLDPSRGGPQENESDRRLVLLADIDDASVRPAYERLTEGLGEFECLAPAPFENLHLTIKLFDSVIEEPVYGTPDTERVDSVVSDVLQEARPFDVEFTRFNLFPDVVYAAVDDGGRLTSLNRQLCARRTVTTMDRDGEAFIPHLTLGYFVDDSDYDGLVSYLETHREVTLPTLTVDELALVAYDIGGGWPPTYTQLETYEL